MMSTKVYFLQPFLEFRIIILICAIFQFIVQIFPPEQKVPIGPLIMGCKSWSSIPR